MNVHWGLAPPLVVPDMAPDSFFWYLKSERTPLWFWDLPTSTDTLSWPRNIL